MKKVTLLLVFWAALCLGGAVFAQTDSLLYEIVQTNPPAGVAPNATDGFCSTNGGALGCDNLQRFVRIDGASGNSVVGKWLSAGDDVAPLLVNFFNVDTVFAEFFDNNTYDVRTIDVNGVEIQFTGTYSVTPSGVGNIQNIVINQSTPSVVTSEGIFEVKTGITGIEDRGLLPFQHSLAQNYPNPFNPSTRIVFQLRKKSPVTLKVFNVAGQEVTTLVDGVRPAGIFTVEFQAGDLPSGVYFYRLQAGDFSQTKRMLLIR